MNTLFTFNEVINPFCLLLMIIDQSFLFTFSQINNFCLHVAKSTTIDLCLHIMGLVNLLFTFYGVKIRFYLPLAKSATIDLHLHFMGSTILC